MINQNELNNNIHNKWCWHCYLHSLFSFGIFSKREKYQSTELRGQKLDQVFKKQA